MLRKSIWKVNMSDVKSIDYMTYLRLIIQRKEFKLVSNHIKGLMKFIKFSKLLSTFSFEIFKNEFMTLFFSYFFQNFQIVFRHQKWQPKYDFINHLSFFCYSFDYLWQFLLNFCNFFTKLSHLIFFGCPLSIFSMYYWFLILLERRDH